jgi:hypothetical protein
MYVNQRKHILSLFKESSYIERLNRRNIGVQGLSRNPYIVIKMLTALKQTLCTRLPEAPLTRRLFGMGGAFVCSDRVFLREGVTYSLLLLFPFIFYGKGTFLSNSFYITDFN